MKTTQLTPLVSVHVGGCKGTLTGKAVCLMFETPSDYSRGYVPGKSPLHYDRLYPFERILQDNDARNMCWGGGSTFCIVGHIYFTPERNRRETFKLVRNILATAKTTEGD